MGCLKYDLKTTVINNKLLLQLKIHSDNVKIVGGNFDTKICPREFFKKKNDCYNPTSIQTTFITMVDINDPSANIIGALLIFEKVTEKQSFSAWPLFLTFFSEK